jgi:hypothetical protein
VSGAGYAPQFMHGFKPCIFAEEFFSGVMLLPFGKH